MGKKDKAKRERGSNSDGAAREFVDASIEERKAQRPSKSHEKNDPMYDDRAAGGRAVPRGGGSVPSETILYLEEVVAHFQTLPAAGGEESGEERMLLVGNVLEELAGKEVLVAGDQACSRHIETLITGASSSQLHQLLTSIHEAEGIQALAASPFGSHVLEKILILLEKGFESMTPEAFESSKNLLASIQEGICAQMQAYSTDRFATHVSRRLLCIAAGRDVMPASKAQRQGQVAAKMKGPSGLAAKMNPSSSSIHPNGQSASSSSEPDLRFPEIVHAVADTLCREDFRGDIMSDLLFSQYASPYLQGLLKAISGDKKRFSSLLPCILGATFFSDSVKSGKVLEGVDVESFRGLSRDPMGSHVIEQVILVSPASIFEEVYSRFFKGSLLDLCHNSISNYVIQALIATPSCSPAIIRQVFEELSPHLTDLISRRRSGVVAALVAACGRMGICQKEVCQVLEKSILCYSQLWAAGLPAEKVLAPALLCLDSIATLSVHKAPAVSGGGKGGSAAGDKANSASEDEPKGSHARLSTLGSSILACLLGYGQGACRTFTDSVAALTGRDASNVASDPSGSRVVEALLEGTAPEKVKTRMMAGLKGGFGRVAMTGAGSFVVEKCFAYGDAGVKEAVVSELLALKRELEATHWGASLLRKVGAEAYSRDPVQWRRHNESSSKVLSQYEQMFSTGEDKGSKKIKGKKEAAKGGDGKGDGKGAVAPPPSSDSAAAFLAEIDDGAVKGDEERKERKKDKKRKAKGDKDGASAVDDIDEVDAIMKEMLGYQEPEAKKGKGKGKKQKL